MFANDIFNIIDELVPRSYALKNDNANQNKRIEKHGEEIDQLDKRVGKLENKVEIYHREH